VEKRFLVHKHPAKSIVPDRLSGLPSLNNAHSVDILVTRPEMSYHMSASVPVLTKRLHLVPKLNQFNEK
jgi:hypothetical protein